MHEHLFIYFMFRNEAIEQKWTKRFHPMIGAYPLYMILRNHEVLPSKNLVLRLIYDLKQSKREEEINEHDMLAIAIGN